MKNLVTLDEILNDRNLFSEDAVRRVREKADREVEKIIHSDKCPNLLIAENPPNFNIKVSSDTRDAINYAHSLGIVINVEDVKLLQYARLHGLTLATLENLV